MQKYFGMNMSLEYIERMVRAFISHGQLLGLFGKGKGYKFLM
jgi:hypothetical protein